MNILQKCAFWIHRMRILEHIPIRIAWIIYLYNLPNTYITELITDLLFQLTQNVHFLWKKSEHFPKSRVHRYLAESTLVPLRAISIRIYNMCAWKKYVFFKRENHKSCSSKVWHGSKSMNVLLSSGENRGFSLLKEMSLRYERNSVSLSFLNFPWTKKLDYMTIKWAYSTEQQKVWC